MPRREARFAVGTRPETLWRFLRDFEALCGCIPGIERLHVVDERTVELTVKEKVGAVPLLVNLTARIEAEDPPRRLRASARAEHLTMAIEVALRETGVASCELTSVFEVQGKGPLKPIVDRLFERRADERAAEFAGALERRFGAAAAKGGPAPQGRLRRLLGWLARLRRTAR